MVATCVLSTLSAAAVVAESAAFSAASRVANIRTNKGKTKVGLVDILVDDGLRT